MDYDFTIMYHSDEAKVVADTLSQKMVTMGTTTYLGVAKQPFSKDIQILESMFLQFVFSEKLGVS